MTITATAPAATTTAEATDRSMPVTAIKNAIALPHYTVGAYDTMEAWNTKIVVVVNGLDGPTWVLRPGCRKVTRRNILALAVPSLDALTLPLVQRLTGVLTDYIVVRDLPVENRRKGLVKGTTVRPMPWNR